MEEKKDESIVDVDAGLGNVDVGLDSDHDGKNSVSIELNYAEGASELITKLRGGEMSFSGKARFVDGVVVFGIDLDGDGEESVKVKLDVGEAIDETTQAIG